MVFDLRIGVVPPGINQTYRTSGKRIYKAQDVKEWQAKAALMIGARAGELGWTDDTDEYALTIVVGGTKFDVDAHIKTVQDTLTQKLGFDDSKISELHVYRDRQSKERYLCLELTGLK